MIPEEVYYGGGIRSYIIIFAEELCINGEKRLMQFVEWMWLINQCLYF